jgi:hypothetical protein
MPMIGWKDRKTGMVYDYFAVFRDIDTGRLVSIMKCQVTGIKYVVIDRFELIDVDGEMLPRFCRWGINGGPDDTF